MNIKDLIDKMYADYIHDNLNTYNRNHIYEGLITIDDKISKMSINNFDDIIDFYIMIYNCIDSDFIISEENKIKILKLKNGNVLIFVSDNTDYNILKKFNEVIVDEAKLINVNKSLLYCTIKKYLKKKLLQEFDILNFNNDEVRLLSQELGKIFDK